MSVLEKLSDWKGTVAYYEAHFKKTILHKMISLLLLQIVISEIATLIFISLGLYFLVKENTSTIALIGLEMSALTLLQFLAGQRIAKDYPGAMNITVYFILNIIGIYLLT
ncbi:DoxX family protein [Lutibacter holmesii]|uniref:DoxX family protein n=1 Tax=Lutibacter holmesii TaxID=1137985 RepID=A0ABW3WL56_9FLAO